jgi:hypothetical protein
VEYIHALPVGFGVTFCRPKGDKIFVLSIKEVYLYLGSLVLVSSDWGILKNITVSTP